MTAEIALMNKAAVVLAADSAVTVGATEKVYDTDKLFPLRPEEPIGVMIYNNTDYMGVPWETFIKTYAGKESRAVQPTVARYVSDLLSHVSALAGTGDTQQVNEIDVDDVGDFTGIVIAGFGENELLPTLYSLRVHDLDGSMVYDINVRRDFELDGLLGVVGRFAQSEMVPRFFDGVDSELLERILSRAKRRFKRVARDLSDSLPDHELDDELDGLVRRHSKKYKKELKSHIRKRYRDPIVQMIQSLPKNELAKLAESLVNLTALKRRVAPETETVGGSIDVAIISKGDGFIWHRRDVGDTGGARSRYGPPRSHRFSAEP